MAGVRGEERLGKTFRLATEDKEVAVPELSVPIGARCFRGEEKPARAGRLRVEKRGERLPDGHFHLAPVIEPGAAQRTIFQRKAERLDEVQMRAGREAEPADVAGIRRDLGLDENDVKHRGSWELSVEGRVTKATRGARKGGARRAQPGAFLPRDSQPSTLNIPQMKRIITSPDAPAAVGPYSQAVAVGNLMFCAGQIPLDPDTGELVAGDVTAQAEQVCRNISAVLQANDMTFTNVIKTTVFLTDLANFAAMNAVYSKYFIEPFPARSTIQVAGLPKGSLVEIEVTAAG